MIIVTGANGFIGSAIVSELNKKSNEEIIAIDSVDLSVRNLLRSKTYKQFFSADGLWSLLAQAEYKEKITWIIHMGACSSTTEKNWDFLYENNFLYSQRLFEWCTQNQKGLIYASSAATYGSGENGFDDRFDSEKLKPLNLYGESKVIMDRWALKQSATPDAWYGLKFFNVFGPNEYKKESMASVAYKAYHQISINKKLGLFKSYNPQYKDGEQLRDFVYVKDITAWIVELMEKKPTSGIYNMGFGQARSWLDMSHALFKSLNVSESIEWLEMPDSLKTQYQYFTEAKMQKWFDAQMSRPKWDLEAAIEDYVKNYLLPGEVLF
jgi:ADP-L-glycero-D-manno-heptose 6-epimerase